MHLPCAPRKRSTTEAVRKYLARAANMLDDAVFGHDEPKERITQVLLDGLCVALLNLPERALQHRMIEVFETCRLGREDTIRIASKWSWIFEQVLCQWISNPDSMSLVLGIQGPPGNGKTTLCRKGIAEALVRPSATNFGVRG